MQTKPSKSKSPVKSNRSRQIKSSTSQNPPKPAKNAGSRIPPPQVNRILERFISGQSIRSIARDEGRDRETISGIVRSMQMQEIIGEQRERFFALAPLALTALEGILELGEDGRVVREVLLDMGVIPTRKEREALLLAEESRLRAFELLERLNFAAPAPNPAANEEGATKATKISDRIAVTKKDAARVNERNRPGRGPDSPSR